MNKFVARNGRDSIAQGEALGNDVPMTVVALKGRGSLGGAWQQIAPKGRDSTAQGAALGNKCETNLVALKGRDSLCAAGRCALSFCAGNGQFTSCRRVQESHPVGVPMFAWRITQGSAALRPGLWNCAASRLQVHPTDSPTIGLILFQDRKRVVAEYALRGMTQPIGVSQYELTRVLPRELRSSLPSIDEIEAELAGPATEQRAVKRRPVKKRAKRKGAKS